MHVITILQQQYEFVHRATQIAMVCRDTTVTTGNIRERTHLLEENSESGQSKLEKEFKVIRIIKDNYIMLSECISPCEFQENRNIVYKIRVM